VRRVLASLRELALGTRPFSELPAEVRLLAERFLPDHPDIGLSIREVVSHADGPLALARYFLGHFFPNPAAYPQRGFLGRHGAHAAHYLRQILRLR
jgi:hypothetical protein